jgi:hypothetical protein
MGRPRILDETLLKKIAQKMGGRADVKSVTKLVVAKASRLRVSSPVALVLVAKDKGIGTATYQSKLTEAAKVELRSALSTTTRQVKIVSSGNGKKTASAVVRIIELVKYDTADHFIKGHIDELNRAYTFKCYTSVFILARKIVENLIIDILKKKFPEKVKANKELYFDINQKRLKDFEEILKNLRSKKNDFGSENKAVERLCDLAAKLKENANNKTHSWYHLVEKKKEVDDLNLNTVFELIKKLEQVIGIR